MMCKYMGILGAMHVFSLALVLAPRAHGQEFQSPEFAGDTGAEFSMWDTFSVGFGGPNAPDVEGSTGDGTLVQTVPGATVTGSGNIYNPAGASRFTIVDAVEGDYRQVVLQVESIGDMDASATTLNYGDGALTASAVELGRTSGGFGDIVQTLWAWDLTAVEASNVEINFSAAASHMSLSKVRLDTLSAPRDLPPMIEAEWDAPTEDRWNYQFNFTPGRRPKASAFRSVEEGVGVHRHATFVMRFRTDDQIPAGLAPEAYHLDGVRLDMLTSSGFDVAYDPTYDGAWTHLPSEDDNALVDQDPGRPIEVFGLGFRDDVVPEEWTETAPFTGGDEDALTVFPAILDASGLLVDVELAVDFEDPKESNPLAIGQMENVSPGSLIPADSPMIFEMNLSDPMAVLYLQRGFSQGYLDFAVTSLNGGGQDSRVFPEFHTKDSLLGEAPALSASVTIVDVVPDAVSIRSVGFDDDRVTVVFTDFLDGRATLEWSEDLVSWTPVEQPVVEPLAEGGVAWVDVDASNAMRFYRLRAF